MFWLLCAWLSCRDISVDWQAMTVSCSFLAIYWNAVSVKLSTDYIVVRLAHGSSFLGFWGSSLPPIFTHMRSILRKSNWITPPCVPCNEIDNAIPPIRVAAFLGSLISSVMYVKSHAYANANNCFLSSHSVTSLHWNSRQVETPSQANHPEKILNFCKRPLFFQNRCLTVHARNQCECNGQIMLRMTVSI